MTALRKLIEAVEASAFDAPPDGARAPYFNRFMDWAEKVFPQNVTGCNALAWRAYHHSSLDAARALHEAVLPGWGWELTDWSSCWVKRTKRVPHQPNELQGVVVLNPARAWLLAILKALEAQQ